MKHLSEIKIQIIIPLLMLIGASLACNYPDAVEVIAEAAMEHCFTVSRNQYESSAAQLGQAPETPKYPESAIYEVCQIEGEPSSVRMTDGNKPEEKPETGESEEGDSVPVGTYVGTSNYPEALSNIFDPGQYTKNEVIVRVADDGTISGSYLLHYIGDPFVINWNEKECTGYGEVDFTGTFFGQLTSSNGMIESEESWVCTVYSNCDDLWDACNTDEPIHREYNVYVSEDEITGTTLPHPEVEDGLIWTFNVKKE